MATSENWEAEALLFAKDLFANLIARDPIFQNFAAVGQNPVKTSPFSDDVFKCLMYRWHESRNSNILQNKLRCDFPNFVMSNIEFEKYLEDMFNILCRNTNSSLKQVITFSATLLELMSFVYRRGFACFVQRASYYWLFMFKLVTPERFYGQGGWKTLKLRVKKQTNAYDENIEDIYQRFGWSFPNKSEEPKTSNEISKQMAKDSADSNSVLIEDSPSFPETTGTTESDSNVDKHEDKTCDNLSKSTEVKQDKTSILAESSKVSESLLGEQESTVAPLGEQESTVAPLGEQESTVAPLKAMEHTTPRERANGYDQSKGKSVNETKHVGRRPSAPQKTSLADTKNSSKIGPKVDTQRRSSLSKNLSSDASKSESDVSKPDKTITPKDRNPPVQHTKRKPQTTSGTIKNDPKSSASATGGVAQKYKPTFSSTKSRSFEKSSDQSSETSVSKSKFKTPERKETSAKIRGTGSGAESEAAHQPGSTERQAMAGRAKTKAPTPRWNP